MSLNKRLASEALTAIRIYVVHPRLACCVRRIGDLNSCGNQNVVTRLTSKYGRTKIRPLQI